MIGVKFENNEMISFNVVNDTIRYMDGVREYIVHNINGLYVGGNLSIDVVATNLYTMEGVSREADITIVFRSPVAAIK